MNLFCDREERPSFINQQLTWARQNDKLGNNTWDSHLGNRSSRSSRFHFGSRPFYPFVYLSVCLLSAYSPPVHSRIEPLAANLGVLRPMRLVGSSHPERSTYSNDVNRPISASRVVAALPSRTPAAPTHEHCEYQEFSELETQ